MHVQDAHFLQINYISVINKTVNSAMCWMSARKIKMLHNKDVHVFIRLF